jgi:hypothetical protein
VQDVTARACHHVPRRRFWHIFHHGWSIGGCLEYE